MASKSLEDPSPCCGMAAAAGTTDIVASPHANQEYAFDPQVVEQKSANCRPRVGDTPRISLWLRFSSHAREYRRRDSLAAASIPSITAGYLLVEFSDFLIPKTTDQIFARMMNAGLRPIVTHPERNQLLQRRAARSGGVGGSGRAVAGDGAIVYGPFRQDRADVRA